MTKDERKEEMAEKEGGHGGLVYAVTAGEYSTYSVLCVCDTRERAELVAALSKATSEGWHRNARVQEFRYVDHEPKRIATYTLQAVVWDSGTVDEMAPRTDTEWTFDTFRNLVPVAWRWVRAPIHGGKGGRLEVWGTDEEAVRHVFGDRKAMLQATDAFRSRKEAKGRGGRP